MLLHPSGRLEKVDGGLRRDCFLKALRASQIHTAKHVVHRPLCIIDGRVGFVDLWALYITDAAHAQQLKQSVTIILTRRR